MSKLSAVGSLAAGNCSTSEGCSKTTHDATKQFQGQEMACILCERLIKYGNLESKGQQESVTIEIEAYQKSCEYWSKSKLLAVICYL